MIRPYYENSLSVLETEASQSEVLPLPYLYLLQPRQLVILNYTSYSEYHMGQTMSTVQHCGIIASFTRQTTSKPQTQAPFSEASGKIKLGERTKHM